MTSNAEATATSLSATALGRLHEVCLRGTCPLTPDDDTAALVDAGYVTVTPDGIRALAAGIAAHAVAVRLPHDSTERSATEEAYERFLALDLEVKRAITDWQMRGSAGKTYLDAEDWAIVDRVRAIHDRVSPMLRRLEAAVPQFAGYRSRLAAALQKVEDDGEFAYVSGVTIDSYHTLWWHLHEELLWALGISRSEDPNQ